MAILKTIYGDIIDQSDILTFIDLVTKNKEDLSYADLYNADLSNANLSNANLSYANLYNANLFNANLSNANLSGANLYNANLFNANLSNANLSYANLLDAILSGANLSNAKYNKFLTQELNSMLLEKGKITAYKIVNRTYEGPWYPSIRYKVGNTYEEENFNSDERVLCGTGLNVATLKWCLMSAKDRGPEWRLLKVEFEASDIVAIPLASDGKFRVKKLKVIEEVDRKTVGL